MLCLAIIDVCLRYTQSHSYALCIIFGCFFLLVHKVTTGLLRSNLFLEMVDKFPEGLSATEEDHTISLFR